MVSISIFDNIEITIKSGQINDTFTIYYWLLL